MMGGDMARFEKMEGAKEGTNDFERPQAQNKGDRLVKKEEQSPPNFMDRYGFERPEELAPHVSLDNKASNTEQEGDVAVARQREDFRFFLDPFPLQSSAIEAFSAREYEMKRLQSFLDTGVIPQQPSEIGPSSARGNEFQERFRKIYSEKLPGWEDEIEQVVTEAASYRKETDALQSEQSFRKSTRKLVSDRIRGALSEQEYEAGYKLLKMGAIAEMKPRYSSLSQQDLENHLDGINVQVQREIANEHYYGIYNP